VIEEGGFDDRGAGAASTLVILLAAVIFARSLPNPEAWRADGRRLRITRIVYRSDTRLLKAVLEGLAGCIELVARNGHASLYRVKETDECPPAALPRAARLYQIWYNAKGGVGAS